MADNAALLLVDDRPENLTALKAVLADEDVDLVTATSGNEALSLTLKRDFALILLDVQMPEMDGFETAELIRANPKTRHLPVIFVTAGLNDTKLQFKGYELGAVDYLIKPFEPQLLRSKARVFADLYRQRRQLESIQVLLELKISERVTQLRASEERFRLLATNAPVGIYQLDAAGRCVFVNPRWCEIAGLNAEEAAGPGWTRTLHGDDREMISAPWHRAQETPGKSSIDCRFVHRNGRVVWASDDLIVLRNDGEITGYLGTNWDITLRRRGEERERMRSEVMAKLAHGAPLPELLELISAGVERSSDTTACLVRLFEEEEDSYKSDRKPGNAEHLEHAEPIRALTGEALGELHCTFFEPDTNEALDKDALREAASLAALVIERKRTENELRIAASVHQALREGIVVTDPQTRIIAVNPAFTELSGYTAAEVIGRNPSMFRSGRHDREFYQRMWQSIEKTGRWRGEIWNRRKTGEAYLEWLAIETVFDSNGDVLRRIGLISDITDQKRAEETIWRQANYDALTELPNRRLFLDRLKHETVRAQRAGRLVALMFIDLDRFKDVNDTFGHHMGDLLLVEAARRISECVRVTDTVARLGGDEFTVIMSDLVHTDRVTQIAQEMIDSLAQPFSLRGEVAYVSASIGITIFPSDTQDVEVLLTNADQAMYVSKGLGRNRYSYFTGSLQSTAQTRLQLGKDLRTALSAGQLELYAQPIVDLASGRVVKAEALLRWRHPAYGMVPPMQFIPIAEESNLINEIGEWVFRESAQTAKKWQEARQAGAPDAPDAEYIQISVNKSPRQFLSGNTEETWVDYLKQLGLPTECIAIEITEGVLLHDRPEVARKLAQFHDAGIRVSLDDFGTGYSAMAYLKTFPIDYLKIDRLFVRDMATDPDAHAIVEAIIVMAHKLGLEVIAEGIETAEQRDMLKAAGCDYGQGFFFAKPMPAADVAAAYPR
jgi:diguanylate cyclase (GGDEF)-like protein/PAS domain S-box-containing protein